MIDGVRCMWMRGGTSKGGYFLASDLPDNVAQRDAFLLSVMGSPDPRQIDGLGGGNPQTSKVAVVKKSNREGVDVDYLFLQVSVETDSVSSVQNCGNILAGIGPFAIERGLVIANSQTTPVTIFMENTGQTAIALVDTPNGRVVYNGSAQIDSVPATAAGIAISFQDTAGSTCGSLLPTGNVVDIFDGIEATCIDNGMPCVVLRAENLGITGTENRDELDANTALKAKLESIRLQAGPLMNLGNVANKIVPKMMLVSSAKNGGAISTRAFIPHKCHVSIGVMGAVTVATSCLLQGSVAHDLASIPQGNTKDIGIEHPIGQITIVANVNDLGDVIQTAVLRTARKLFDGKVFGA